MSYKVKITSDMGLTFLSCTQYEHRWSSIRIDDIAHEVPLLIAALEGLTTGEKPPLSDDLVAGVHSELPEAQKRIAALEEAIKDILTQYAVIYRGPEPAWIRTARLLMEKVGSDE